MALTTRIFSTTTGPGGISSNSNPMTAKVLAVLNVPAKATKVGAKSGGSRR